MLQKKIPLPKRATKKVYIKKTTEAAPAPTTCTCNSRLHALNLEMPNCLHCGFVLCVQNTTGFCPSCSKPLHEYSAAASGHGTEYSAANTTLARLLSYQRSSALRTQIIDQVSDFATTATDPSQWASKDEQARIRQQQLKNEERMQREHDQRNGRGRQVLSISLRGNKVVLTEAPAEVYKEEPEPLPIEDDGRDPEYVADPDAGQKNKHHSRALIRPVYIGEEKVKGRAGEQDAAPEVSRLQYNEQYNDSLALEV